MRSSQPHQKIAGLITLPQALLLQRLARLDQRHPARFWPPIALGGGRAIPHSQILARLVSRGWAESTPLAPPSRRLGYRIRPPGLALLNIIELWL